MIHSHRLLFALILALALWSRLSAFTHAQQDNALPNKEEITALREKAFKLLESVAAQLNTLQSAENRARMGSNLVDSLWKHDEQRARSLLRMVQEDIKTELQKQEKRLPGDPTFSVFLKLRQDTVERVAKHDAEAALSFLKVTQPIFEGRTPHDFRENEQALELRLGKQLAAANPDVALKLGRQALERGFSRDLLTLLARLNRQHRQHGQTLYKEIVEKLRDADVVNDWDVRYFSHALVQSFQPPNADELTYRELVGVFVSKALTNGCGSKLPDEDERANFCVWVASSVQPAEKYDSRAGRLKHWGIDVHNSTQNLSIALQEVDELMQENAFDQLEALANQQPGLQDIIYIRLIQKAMYSNDFDQARKLINRFVTDPQRQTELRAQVEGREKSLMVNEEKLAEIQRKLPEMANDQGRVRFLLTQADQLGATDPKVALKLLNQAGEIIEAMKPGKEQTQARLALAMLYCFEKNDRGFTIMESLVPKLNELVEVAVRLDGYDTNYLRDGEWNMSANGSIGQLLTQLSQRAGYFAWCDFDRAVTLASQFERPEIRLMAHLKLAQAILAGPPNRLSGN